MTFKINLVVEIDNIDSVGPDVLSRMCLRLHKETQEALHKKNEDVHVAIGPIGVNEQ